TSSREVGREPPEGHGPRGPAAEERLAPRAADGPRGPRWRVPGRRGEHAHPRALASRGLGRVRAPGRAPARLAWRWTVTADHALGLLSALLLAVAGLVAVAFVVAAVRLARWATAPLPRPNPLLALWQAQRSDRGEFPAGVPEVVR